MELAIHMNAARTPSVNSHICLKRVWLIRRYSWTLCKLILYMNFKAPWMIRRHPWPLCKLILHIIFRTPRVIRKHAFDLHKFQVCKRDSLCHQHSSDLLWDCQTQCVLFWDQKEAPDKTPLHLSNCTRVIWPAMKLFCQSSKACKPSKWHVMVWQLSQGAWPGR